MKYLINSVMARRVTIPLVVGMACIFWVSSAFAQDGEMSADETAKKLANPAGSLANLANNLSYRTYKGDLPGAENQSALSYTFQPVLPFPVGEKGHNITFRPAFNVTFNQPIYSVTDDTFKDLGTNLNDLTFDLVFAGNTMKADHKGYLWGMGLAGTLPIATDSLSGGNQWRFGPELFGGVLRSWGVIGALVNNQFNVAGSSDQPYSTTTAQYFYGITLGGGWQILSAPVITYDWKADSGEGLSIPLGTGIARTVKIGSTPWRFQLEVWYYVEQPDSFGSDWFMSFDFRPVIKNPFVRKNKN
jgi:hypothetical protein